MTENEAINALGILDRACNPPLTDVQAKIVKFEMMRNRYYGVARPVAGAKGKWLPLVSADGCRFDCISIMGYKVAASFDRIGYKKLERMYG